MKGGNGSKKGLWTGEEDSVLMEYVRVHGKSRWNHIAKSAGLKRSGKSCRLRWMNYLNPNIKHDEFTEEEDDLIIRLHNLLGNRWSLIAGRVPGRTDNQIKNHWNTYLRSKLGLNKAAKLNTRVEQASSQTLRLPESRTDFSVSPGSRRTTSPKAVTYNSDNSGVAHQIQGAVEDGFGHQFGWLNLPELALNESPAGNPSLLEFFNHLSPEFTWDGFF